MNELTPPSDPTRRTLAARVKDSLGPVVSTAVPGVMVGAIYLATGSHWMALKATLPSWIAPALSRGVAPLVAVVAILGVRYLFRLMVAGTDSNED